MGMSREERDFPLGSLVIVKRGHHAGSVFAVLGILNEQNRDRILIADGMRISAGNPKRKNPRHVMSAGIVSSDVAERLAGGHKIDDGWLAEVISRLAN
jgi:ribosomal protein L14E/L6E/L27E